MSLGHLAREFQCSNRVFAGNGGKIVEELIQRVARFKVVVKRLDRHPRTDEHRSPPEDFWVAVNHRWLRKHG